MEADTNRSFPRHTHEQFGLGIVVRGRHASWSGRGHVEAGPGQFICVNPGEVHDGHAVLGRARRWRILYFEPQVIEYVERDILDGGRTGFEFTAPVFDHPELRSVFANAFALAGRSRVMENGGSAEAALVSVVGCLTVRHRGTPIAHRSSRSHVLQAKRLIDADPCLPWSLSELAGETGVTRYQLLRGFVKELGMPPHAYIVQHRLELSKRLIRSGHELADVAARAGFSDQSHLTRKFLRQYGVTPHRYRVAMR